MKRPHESLTVLFDTDYDQLLELIVDDAPQEIPNKDAEYPWFLIRLDECPWDYI